MHTSPYWYHLRNPTEAQKQMSVKITINHGSEMDLKQFSKNLKELSLDDLIDKLDEHLKFHCMDSEFYLLDPQDSLPTPHLCYLLQEDTRFQPKIVITHFHTNATLYEYTHSKPCCIHTKHYFAFSMILLQKQFSLTFPRA